MNDTQTLRMLINRVDGIMQKINGSVYETQKDIRAALRDALLKTGKWVH